MSYICILAHRVAYQGLVWGGIAQLTFSWCCFNTGKWIPKIALADDSSSAEEDAEGNDTVNLEKDEEEWQIWQIYESIFIVKIMYINSN